MKNEMIERVKEVLRSQQMLDKSYSEIARDVILAMREPTDAMLATAEDVQVYWDENGRWQYLATPGQYGVARDAWYSMIDAAAKLPDPKEPILELLRQALDGTSVTVTFEGDRLAFRNEMHAYKFDPDSYNWVNTFVYGLRLANGLQCYCDAMVQIGAKLQALRKS